jgi:hypothetical protein
METLIYIDGDDLICYIFLVSSYYIYIMYVFRTRSCMYYTYIYIYIYNICVCIEPFCSQIYAKIIKKQVFVAMATAVSSCMIAETISLDGNKSGNGTQNKPRKRRDWRYSPSCEKSLVYFLENWFLIIVLVNDLVGGDI